MGNFEFSDIVTFALAAAGLVTAIGGAISYIKKWYQESKGAKNSEIIQEHTEQLRSIDERLSALESANASQDKYVNAMCATMIAMLDHAITGNSIDKLKKAREDMQEYLIHRGGG